MKKSNFSYSRVWGCLAHVKKHDTNKIESRTKLCRFMEYLRETIRYYFYCPREKSIFVTKRTAFLEDEYLLRRDRGSKVVMAEVADPDTNATSLDDNSAHENLQVDTKAPRRSSRVLRQSN